jgi:hypothetical protein
VCYFLSLANVVPGGVTRRLACLLEGNPVWFCACNFRLKGVYNAGKAGRWGGTVVRPSLGLVSVVLLGMLRVCGEVEVEKCRSSLVWGRINELDQSRV